MSHKITHLLPQSCAAPRTVAGRSQRLLMLLLTLEALAGTGCFRATGLQRNPMVAEPLPETGGDRVNGLRTKAGAGDLYLGNDFIQVAIDSVVYGDPYRTPLAGAASGGSIVDAGYLALDASYNRVSMPGNVMNRLTPVVNQDPDLPVVFNSYQVMNTGSLPSIAMTGSLLDSQNKLGRGAGIVPGVSVTHLLTVAQLDRFFTVTTIVTNNGASPVGIRNIGDCLIQQGGGYRFAVPANFDASGTALPTSDGLGHALYPWGVQLVPDGTQANSSDFTQPLATSVQAPMVGLMNTEPGANAQDSHASLGLLPLDADRLLVAADPQDLLTVSATLRPAFPPRLVAGSLPAAGSLAPGASLSYHRRLYILGGRSVDTNLVGGQGLAINFPSGSNGLFNLMDSARYFDTTIRPTPDMGMLTYTLSGSSQRQGPLPTEIRIERNVTAVTPAQVSSQDVWQVQRVEWFEPNENLASTTGLAPSILSAWLPVGIYRMTLRTRTATQTRTLFENINDPDRVTLPGPIWIQAGQTFVVNPQDILCPDGLDDPADPNQVGAITNNPFSTIYFTTREANGPGNNLQPLRLTFQGTGGTPDPVMRRMRTLGSLWDPVNNVPGLAPGGIPGQSQFRGGNEMFGGGFTGTVPSTFAWLPNGGRFTVYGSRGPLEPIQSQDLAVQDGQTDNSRVFTVTNLGLPSGWASFDMPGPGQATTGGYLPSEKLASALANGVQIVANTEQDLQVDPSGLYSDFEYEYGFSVLSTFMRPASLSAVNRPPGTPCGAEPFVVGARSSTLAGSPPASSYGTVTALFTPVAVFERMGGAQVSNGWTLADFLTQAQGQFNVVQRPRGPNGLFTLQGVGPAQGQVQSWWNSWSGLSTGPLAFGRKNGSFEALELLRAESLASAGPTSWFQEFLQVRSDWFALLNLQTPANFTKALGLSSGQYSIDTPVGLARTYLKAYPQVESDLSSVLAALKHGAAVASTGPLVDASIGAAGPGDTVPGPVMSVTLTVNLYKPDWVPVDELRVVVNGVVVRTITPAIGAGGLTAAGTDPRLYTGTFTVTMPSPATGAWVVVEAGVPLNTSGPYAAGTPWNLVNRGIYPIAVTNPIFVNVTGGAYVPPSSAQ